MTRLRHPIQMLSTQRQPSHHAGWLSIQQDLARVDRWSSFPSRKPGKRRQNSAVHSLGLVALATSLLERMELIDQVDWGMIQCACAIHDFGEGVLRKDVPHPKKTARHDLAEYAAFCQFYGDCRDSEHQTMHRAFLLQFCLRNPRQFPTVARKIMRELAVTHRREAIIFAFLEQYDYILYAVEQYHRRGNVKLLVTILQQNLHKIRRLVIEDDRLLWVWPPALHMELFSIMEAYEDRWPKRVRSASRAKRAS